MEGTGQSQPNDCHGGRRWGAQPRWQLSPSKRAQLAEPAATGGTRSGQGWRQACSSSRWAGTSDPSLALLCCTFPQVGLCRSHLGPLASGRQRCTAWLLGGEWGEWRLHVSLACWCVKSQGRACVHVCPTPGQHLCPWSSSSWPRMRPQLLAKQRD